MGLGIKTHLLHHWNELSGKNPRHFAGHYDDWRAKRICAILDHYGNRFFTGKTVLELGAGHGDIGAFFGTLGSRVTCLEGRQKNVTVIRRRHPHVESRLFDLNEELSSEIYDVIIHMGLLYHLHEPEKSLRNACSRTTNLILETLCCDSDDPNLLLSESEKKCGYDQALHGVGCRPSPAWVERILQDCAFQFTRINDNRCNSDVHTYDWPITNTAVYHQGYRRFWFAQRV